MLIMNDQKQQKQNNAKINISHLSLVHTVLVSVPAAPRCGHRGPPGPHRSDAGKHRSESGYTVLNRHLPGSGPGGFNIFKTTGAHRGAKQRRLFPGHPRSSSGMNRIFNFRPPGDTVASRHKLCPRWRYGDSRLGHGVSRRRTGIAPVYTFE